MRSVGDVFAKTNRLKAVGLEVFLFAFDFSNQQLLVFRVDVSRYQNAAYYDSYKAGHKNKHGRLHRLRLLINVGGLLAANQVFQACLAGDPVAFGFALRIACNEQFFQRR